MQTSMNRHERTGRNSNKTIYFASVRFEGLRGMLRTPFRLREHEEKCDRFARHGRNAVNVLFIYLFIYLLYSVMCFQR
jgi:hypothetical protein